MTCGSPGSQAVVPYMLKTEDLKKPKKLLMQRVSEPGLLFSLSYRGQC